jgi:hypothetical protein
MTKMVFNHLNYHIFSLFLTLAISLFAVDSDTAIVIDGTSCNVRDAVHAPTGQSFVRRNDAVVSGFESIPISRMYVSENTSALNWKGGWAIFPHCQFTLFLTEKGMFATIQEPEGTVVRYRTVDNAQTLVADLENSHAPPFNREISGRTDIRNNRMILHKNKKKKLSGATLYLGNGGQRIYRLKRDIHHPIGWFFLLEEEIKPNGNRVSYRHDDSERIKIISTWNPQKTKQYASLTFDYRGKKSKDRDCILTGSDGTSLYYHFWRSQNGSFITTHSFRYEHSTHMGPGVTKVRDVLNNETHYYFDTYFKPSKIEFYTPAGLARTEIFF